MAVPVGFATALAAQPNTTIADTAVCSNCSLDLRLSAHLAMPSDSSAYPSWVSSVTRNARGQYLVTPLDNLGTFAVFSPEGRFDRTVGRVGQGPGEFRYAIQIRVGVNDTVEVLDQVHKSVSILGPQGSFVRSVPLPGFASSVLRVRGDTLLVNSAVGTSAAIGNPFHLMTERGELLRSFGYDGTPYEAFGQAGASRSFAFLGGRVLSLSPTSKEYVIEQWTLNGELLRRVHRANPWFGNPKLQTQLLGLQVLDERYVVVVIRIQDVPSRTIARAGEEQKVLGFVEGERDVDTIIEVIEWSSLQLMARIRADEGLLPSATAGLLYRYRDEGDVMKLDVYDLRFRFPQPGRIQQ